MHSLRFPVCVSPGGWDAHSLAVWRPGVREQVPVGWFLVGVPPPPCPQVSRRVGERALGGLLLWGADPARARLQTPHAGG